MGKILLILTIFFNVITLNVFSGYYGNPIIRHYLSDDYPDITQTYAISQDSLGQMYFGNSYGVTKYNGQFFKKFRTINNSVVSSLCYTDSIIYVGGTDEFGGIRSLDNGKELYFSLVNQLPEEERNFGIVQNIFLRTNEIVFVSSHSIFIYKDGFFRIIKSKSLFMNSFAINDSIYVNQSELGLYKLSKDNLELKVKYNSSQQQYVLSAVKDDNRVFGITNTGSVYVLQLTEYNDLNNEEYKIDKKYGTVTSVLANNNNFIVGTSDGNVLFLNPKSHSINQINISDNQVFKRILTVCFDRFGNLWVGHNNGITTVEYTTGFTYINSSFVRGSGYAFEQIDSNLFFGTSHGLYSAKDNNYSLEQITEVKNSSGQVWFLKNIDGELYMGHNKGLLKIKDNNAEIIDNKAGAWDLKKIKGSNLYIEGTYSGLQIFKKEKNKLSLYRKFPEFKESCRIYELEPSKHRIWVTHGYKGVFKLTLNSSYDSIQSIQFYNETSGFPSSLGINVFKINDTLLFTSEHGGIYSYNEENDNFVDYNKFEPYIGKCPKISKLYNDDNGNIWVCELDSIGYLKPLYNDSFTYVHQPFFKLKNALVRGFEMIRTVNENEIMFGIGSGFVHYNPQAKKLYNQSFNVLINSVEVLSRNDSTIYYGGNINEKEKYITKIPYKENDLRFIFSAAFYEEININEYSYKLLGYDDAWSPWTRDNKREYTNLPMGNYTFVVKAKNIYGTESEWDVYRFEILTPWYQTIVAMLTYILLLALLLALFVKIYLNYKQKENKRKMAFQEQEIIKLRNQKLKNELQHRNDELGSLTLQLVHKNEVLNEIKNKLNIIENTLPKELQRNFSRVYKLINNEIVNERDWSYFEMHFDKVYHNFFKQLKSLYPTLNTNELKLCAYLRMNLTSKEIAALLNSTSGGIDASRYRLRKKLDLAHDENLKDFLVTLGFEN
jgi:ligand-binding sensor domain-containing protein